MLWTAVFFGHAEVVFEHLVRGRQTVAQLVACEQIVVATRLVARTVLRIDRAPDRPHGALFALDPDDDRLFGPSIVDAVNDSLGEAALRRFPPHRARIQSRRCRACRACCAHRSRFSSRVRAPRTAWRRMSFASTAAGAVSRRSSTTATCRTA